MAEPRPAGALELWGGVECTVNRVGDAFHDQLARNGHLERTADIDAFAELGLRALRVPVLWERSVHAAHEQADLRHCEPMLERVRQRGLRAIAGLVHHGSGPRFTHLLDPGFAPLVAAYAEQVARRFPWLTDFTPINEPLTTARFSALYGHWYPHARTTTEFLRALVHECRATILAMQAIRRVIPEARLVQTEDIGTVFSTPHLAYQAEYENHRRWLSLDLLCGRVDRGHPLYRHLIEEGIGEAELAWFVEEACPPDLIGINYYFTSDRYLDEDLGRYPPWHHGGNGRDRYADVAAVMVEGVGLSGHRAVIQSVWERYRTPIALTEVHAGCTREEQLRWFEEAHCSALDALTHGVEVRAVTAWALLGSFDWNSLVTREAGHYEAGAFDLRAPRPRPTALASIVRGLAREGTFDHPALAGQGWWRRTARTACPRRARRRVKPQPLLISGRRGTLGQAFARACEARGLAHVLLDRQALDIADREAVERALGGLTPWAVVNASGYVRVDEAEADSERCRRENVVGPSLLAQSCDEHGVRLVTFSSDLVFDGTRRAPYLEGDPVAPLSVYGRSKAEAEQRVLERLEQALIVRTSAFFGPVDAYNFVTLALRELAQGRTFRAAADAVVSPTYVPHLVDATLDLLIDGASGVWHLANVGAVSWAELATRAAELAKLPVELVEPRPLEELAWRAPRPRYSALGSERGTIMPSLEDALQAYLRDGPLAQARAV